MKALPTAQHGISPICIQGLKEPQQKQSLRMKDFKIVDFDMNKESYVTFLCPYLLNSIIQCNP